MAWFIEWWEALSFTYQVFYGIGIIALFVVLVQTAMMMVGIGIDHGDIDGLHHMDAGEMKLLSIRSITGFFLGFGWGGVIAMKMGASGVVGILAGFGLGCAIMFSFVALMRFLIAMRSSGTLDYKNAVGQVATVYVTIPPKGEGVGQIEVMLQGRLITAEAQNAAGTTIKPQQKVSVTGMSGNSSFLVEAV